MTPSERTCRPPLASLSPVHGASPIAPLRPIRAPAGWFTQRATSAANPGRRDRRTCSSPPLPLCTLTSPHRVPACTGLATAPPSTCWTTWPCCTMRAPSRSRDCSDVASTTKILASSAEMCGSCDCSPIQAARSLPPGPIERPCLRRLAPSTLFLVQVSCNIVCVTTDHSTLFLRSNYLTIAS